MSYGSDVWCTDRLVTSRRARGRTVVLQALYRRLITPRGTLRGGPAEAAYGLDVSGYIGAVGYDVALNALPGLVRGELRKDDRVTDVVVTVTRSRDSAGLIALVISVDGRLVDEDEDFAFTIRATDLSVEALGGMS